MKNRMWLRASSGVAVALVGGLFAYAQNKAAEKEQERKVAEAEVSKPALDALKKQADKAAITEFAEEIEHGHKFFEGTWAGPNGKIDCLVTDTGDLVAIEETFPAEKVPAAVRAEVEKAAGKEAKLSFEKITMVMYEVHFKKEGKGHEMMFTPDGLCEKSEADEEGEKDDDEKEGTDGHRSPIAG